MKITIMRDQLIAALCTAALKDVRYYLQGVYVEATNMETRLTSTNGTVLSTQRADAKGDNEVDGVVRMILPLNAIEKVKKHKIFLTVEINDEGGKLGLVDGAARIGFEPLEGTFPDYRRIIPSNTTGVACQFDPRLLVPFAKAAVILEATYKSLPQVLISHNGESGALVTLGDRQDYVGVLMPIRGAAPSAPPAWAREQLIAPAEELV